MSQTKKVLLNIETSRAYGRGLLSGISMYSTVRGLWSFYHISGGMEKRIPDLADWGADGAIIRELRDTEKVLSLNIPTVICLNQAVKVSSDIIINTDQAEIAGLAAEHFLERKFKNFAFSGPKSMWSKVQARVIEWLKSLPKPVALMTAVDEHAQYIIESCKIAGLNVPTDVVVLGVDNDPMICEFTTPTLSSVHLDTKSAGYRAAELLDKLMRGEKCDQRKIMVRASHVAERVSTDIMAIDDQLVAQAILCIRSQSKEQIQVGDVAKAVAISRSALDRRFRKALGRSVLQEIKRIRVDQIAKMLMETDMTVSQIAMAMNFTGIEHVGRYFKSQMGISPSLYRKKRKGEAIEQH